MPPHLYSVITYRPSKRQFLVVTDERAPPMACTDKSTTRNQTLKYFKKRKQNNNWVMLQ